MVCRWYAVSSYYFYFMKKSITNPHLFLSFFSKNSSEFANYQGPVYFNRTDVKKAINAPLDVEWVPCSVNNVFNTTDGVDESLPPAFTVLPSVIEKNLRTVVIHGLADYVLIAEGFVFYLFYFLVQGINIYSFYFIFIVFRTRIVIQK